MKRGTRQLTIAAALLATSSITWGQKLETEVPFVFRAGGTVLAPGAYTVEFTGPSHEVVVLKNWATKRSVVLLSDAGVQDAAGRPVLTFRCGVSRCELREIHTGASQQIQKLPHHNLGRDEK